MRPFGIRLLGRRARQAMSEREVTDNLSPQANVTLLPTTSPGVAPTAQAPGGETFHPLADLERQLNAAQRETLAQLRERDDHCEVERVLPDQAWVVSTSYDDGGRTITHHVITNEGTVF